MVLLCQILYGKSASTRVFLKKRFIDSVRLHVSGGAGGNGLPKRGGIGGKGGDIFLVGKEGIKLKDVIMKNRTKRIKATCGEHSQVKSILGAPGEDKIIEVPIGITVLDDYGRILGEVDSESSKILVAKGGPGGSPSTDFFGLAGQVHNITLDLKLIADVGLVGFPNAGKSSLLKAVSRARPKIASYPFTTIEPNIGILQYEDLRTITMADLPGLIEGAHANVGMGHKFLKHVERTKLILMIVDINGFQLSPHYPHRSVLETIVLLHKELELYQEDLLRKPIVLGVNKMDMPNAERKWDELKEKLKSYHSVIKDFSEDIQPKEPIEFCHITNISVKSCNKSVLDLKSKIRELLDLEAEKLTENEEHNLRQQLQRKMVESGPNAM